MKESIKKALKASVYDLLIGATSLLGAAIGTDLTYPYGVVPTIIGSFMGGVFFLALSVFIAKLFRPRYTIKKHRVSEIFLNKLESDINCFCDSNTSAIESNNRLLEDSASIIELASNKDNIETKSYDEAPEFMLENETQGFMSVRDWLENGASKASSFASIMDGRGLHVMAEIYAKEIINSIKENILKINSSIVEPRCIALVEKMRDYGVPIEHVHTDINGIQQARTLASDEEFSASFVPFSTVFLAQNKQRIIERYKYIIPVTWEDQMIIGKRNNEGIFYFIK